MIIEFSVKNYRSIKELQTVSFVATGLKSSEQYLDVDKNNIVQIDDLRILKTVGIYGPNASGKSNVIRALEYFLQVIKNDPTPNSNLQPLFDPFLFQEIDDDCESIFQITLLIERKKYRYGFSVKRKPFLNYEKANLQESLEYINREWLIGTKEKNMRSLFERKMMEVKKDGLENKDKIPALPSEHILFLTHAAAFDVEGVCQKIRNYIKYWTVSNFQDGVEQFRWHSISALLKENRKDKFLHLLKSFGIVYDDITVELESSDVNNLTVPMEKIFFHKYYIANAATNFKNNVFLNLRNNESAGTQKLFDLAGLLLRAFSLPVGAFIMLDEIDSNFHPSLLIKLIHFFNDPQINSSNVQLLFTSHDTNLMSPSLMRRDQFYFTEKMEDQSTRLYSLSDLKGIRNDVEFAKQYLAGFYGALPVLSNYIDKSDEN